MLFWIKDLYFTNHGANDTDIKGKLMVTKKKKQHGGNAFIVKNTTPELA